MYNKEMIIDILNELDIDYKDNEDRLCFKYNNEEFTISYNERKCNEYTIWENGIFYSFWIEGYEKGMASPNKTPFTKEEIKRMLTDYIKYKPKAQMTIFDFM